MTSVAAVIEQNNQIIRNNCPEVTSHQDSDCCRNARKWLIGMARSFDFRVTDSTVFSGPGWLKEIYKWGPSPWPIHWCEALRLDTIDCGLFRAFAQEIFAAKGIEVFSAQVLRYQNPSTTAHWQARWRLTENALPWAATNFVYHEICAIKSQESSCELYDPTDGNWIDPDIVKGHGGHFAVRIETPEVLQWQRHTLGGHQWISL